MPVVLISNTLDVVVRQDHRWIRYQDDLHVRSLLDIEDAFAFLVEEKCGHLDRKPRDDAAGQVLHRFFFDDSQNRQGE